MIGPHLAVVASFRTMFIRVPPHIWNMQRRCKYHKAQDSRNKLVQKFSIILYPSMVKMPGYLAVSKPSTIPTHHVKSSSCSVVVLEGGAALWARPLSPVHTTGPCCTSILISNSSAVHALHITIIEKYTRTTIRSMGRPAQTMPKHSTCVQLCNCMGTGSDVILSEVHVNCVNCTGTIEHARVEYFPCIALLKSIPNKTYNNIMWSCDQTASLEQVDPSFQTIASQLHIGIASECAVVFNTIL